MNIIQGSDLMLFVKNANGEVKSLAFATSHSLSITGETTDISTKDHGIYGATELTRVTWSITTDNLYTLSTFNDLYDRMISRQTVECYFCLKDPAQRAGNPPTVNLEGDTYDTWTPTSTQGEDGFYGRAYITSLDATAAAGENATFSATFSGVGALTKGLYGSVEAAAGGSTDITIGTDTYERASSYESGTQYYIYQGSTMVPVTISSASEASKLVLYTKKSS